jgi:hypothetical protein
MVLDLHFELKKIKKKKGGEKVKKILVPTDGNNFEVQD